ncbi:MAG: terminase family protein [Pseudonocardia sp.]|nr:terminase family protein [Pseudonocardia sp.]
MLPRTDTLAKQYAAKLSPEEMGVLVARVKAEAARLRTINENPTALDLAARYAPGTVRTPALELVAARLAATVSSRGGQLVVSVPPQEGKALALDTPIATPAGWTTMGELRVGDEVFDRHGDPCHVTALSPTWTGRPCYRVRTGDGEEIVADAAHEWPVRLDRRTGEHLHTTERLAHSRSKNAQITGPAALNLPDADLPLDPYTLGVWLGDGHTDSARITSADAEVVDHIRDAGIEVHPATHPLLYSLGPRHVRKGSPRGSRGEVAAALVEAGVLGDKHIPAAYLRASEKQRLALLQGLVDSDGYVMPKGQVEFCATNRRLAEDVRELVFTLGAKATLHEGRAMLNGRDCGPKYRVRFYRAAAAHLPRKAVRCRDSSVARVRYVRAEPTESVATRCIEVDSPDHTYLAGRSLLPTHNSTLLEWLCVWLLCDQPDRRIVYASYAHGLARRSGRHVRGHITTHGPALGLTLDRGHADASDWQLDGHNGGMFTTGVGGGLTGRPADVLIVDDPIKGQKEADSELIRDSLHDWWSSVAQTRLAPGAPVIVVQTRWHEDDLAGRRIEDAWPAVNIPALADGRTDDALHREPGVWLASARARTAEEWADIRKRVGERTFAALYQGRPAPLEGGIFRQAWIDAHRADQLPPVATTTVAVDPADTGQGDAAGILVGSRALDGTIYVRADLSGMLSQGEWARVALLAAVRFGADTILQESNLGMGRSLRDGWALIARQAQALREAGTPDEAATLLAGRGDGPAAHRAQLTELGDVLDDILACPSTGPAHVKAVTPRQSKYVRAHAVTSLYETGRARHVGRLPLLEHEMITWQSGQKSPNRLDTLAHLLTHLDAARQPATVSRPTTRVPTRTSGNPRRAAIRRA